MSTKRILVTGGCGYIGSHTIVDLIENGFEVVSVDNLSNADDEILNGVQEITGVQVQNHKVDLSDPEACELLFKSIGQIDGIIHFAAHKSVGESVEQPLKYYLNNLNSLIYLLQAVKQYQIPYFIFSSSCSVYGNPDALPVTEETPMKYAESPYAYSKQIGERMIQDVAAIESQTKYILLRYFNPAGAHDSGWIGEQPINKASNLVPVITETAIGKRDKMMVFGSDYPTRDGTCVRDYIHVMDLAHAHTLALVRLIEQPEAPSCDIFNLGIGEGATVKECIDAFIRVTGKPLNFEMAPRRAGDVIAVYADNTKARELLGWIPFKSVDEIMLSAWNWEMKRSAAE
jgi:UDP-glucose 4-epimerase